MMDYRKQSIIFFPDRPTDEFLCVFNARYGHRIIAFLAMGNRLQ